MNRLFQHASWHVWCPYNVPYIDWHEWYLLPSVSVCNMAGFRGLHLRFLFFHWGLGWHYCDSMSHVI